MEKLFKLAAFLGWLLIPAISAAQVKSTDKPKYGGQVTYGALRDIRTTNPFIETYSNDYNVRSLMFEGLTGLEKGSNVVACLARSWDISKDGMTYTFSLRNGVKFHNGKPLVGEDVKWSMDYIRDPKNRAYFLEQFTEVKSVETSDPGTVVFTLKKPFSPLVAILATARAPILPAGSQWTPNTYPSGTGPFRFVEWQSGQHVTLKAFKKYWIPGVPYLDQITFKPITDDSVRVTALKAGNVDFAEELPYSVGAEALKGKQEFVLVLHEAGDRRRIVFNNRMPPFNDVRVRQAVAYAIDKKELIEGRTWGFSKPANQRFPSSSKWYIDMKDREPDLKKARALLAEAGYKDGLKFKAPVYPGPDMELTTVIKDQLKRAGIEMDLDVMDWASHTKVRNTRQFTLYAAGMGGRAEPHQMYYNDLYSKSTGNGSGYSNPELDQLVEKAAQVLDFKERKRLYGEALRIIQRDVPEIYLNMGPLLVGVRPHVKNFSSAGMEERIGYMGGGMAYTWIEHEESKK